MLKGSNGSFAVVDAWSTTIHGSESFRLIEDELDIEWTLSTENVIARSRRVAYFINSIIDDPRAQPAGIVGIKLILSAKSGYVINSGAPRQRMIDCDLVDSCMDFTNPGQSIEKCQAHDFATLGLLKVFNKAVSGISIRPSTNEDVARLPRATKCFWTQCSHIDHPFNIFKQA